MGFQKSTITIFDLPPSLLNTHTHTHTHKHTVSDTRIHATCRQPTSWIVIYESAADLVRAEKECLSFAPVERARFALVYHHRRV
jgi:hypothetical protein